MRVTVTLDPDVAKDIKKLMLIEGATFKEVVNKTLLRGLNVLSKNRPKFPRRRIEK
jgi:hypothetical protein